MRKRKLDPLPGAETFVWLTWQGDDWPKEEAEIVLWWSARGDIFARHQAGQAPVEPRSSQDRAKLERFRLGTEPHVTIVVEARRHPQRRPWGELGVTISRFDTGGSLPPQQIAFDDKPCQTIARWERSKIYETQPERTRDWLARHFLLPDLPGVDEVAERVVVSTVFDEVGSSGYTIHGRGYVADVRMIDDRLRLQRLRRPTERDRKRRLRLVRAKVEFEDVSRVGELRADMRQWIDRLVEGEGFLAMWRDYNRLETRYVRRLVRETGSCHYQGWQRIAGGGYRFTVESPVPSPADDKSSLLRQAHRAVERNVKLELEAAAKLPAFLLEYGDDDSDADDWSLIENRLERHVFSGTVTGVDVAKGTIDIESIQLHGRGPSGVGGDRDTDLPKSGVLFRSFRGDRSQLARRREAFDRIRTGGTNIPNLLALLEGERVDAKPPERIPIRSDAAWAIFKGKPTKSQQDAIDVALNTPDIAIIKGPPGTGKTEVIAAIQTRLAESGKSFAQLRGSILLTSFQHAAVDEMAGRSVIFGIPADKVDRADRGSAVLRDRLRDDISTGVQARMAEPAAAVLALRKLSGRVAGYWLSPHSVKSTVTLLTDMLRDAGPYLSAALVDRLRTARDELTIGEQAPVPAERTEARELALRALRGLRTEPAAFADDGPRTAAKALRRLRALAANEEAFARHDLDLLVRAAEWAAAEPPDFLPELTGLRDQLMDPLITIDGPAPVLTADPAVADLLNEAIEEMDDALRRSPDTGPALALVDYLESFYGDPQAVEWTLRSYTASYATTCQQAVSKKIATAKSVKDSEDVVFDTVIVDEAARANPLDLMIPMTLAARRVVLVGDHHQLPPMLEPDVEQQFVDEDEEKRAALRQSLFERLFKAHGQAGAPVERVVTLNEQFRMHEVLGDFVSRNFYDGQLGSPLGSTGFAHKLKYGDAVAVWLDVPNDQGEEYRKRSTHRPIEANRLVQELEPLIRSAPDLTFGVVSFYTDQVESIGDALVARGIAKRVDGGRYEASEQFRQDSKGKPLNRLLVGSVDAFQGKQFDVVLLSTTRSAPASDNVRPRLGSRDYLKWERRRYGHVLLKNRLCVAMSRQRRLLLVVGDAAMFEPDRAPVGAAPITDFLRLCRTGGDHGDFIPA
jgi:MoxR-like ATPase